ncbi:MAG: hypothetical protein HPY59_11825 [Anaerolineae bacterium]|nr:hypothetical protein [Anaerolineae bacterium]
MQTKRTNLNSVPPPAANRQAIRRLNAEKYLVWMLLSFAASVSLTRLFLELTGYPQLGSKELHIAHVLWGGLFLFVAALLPVILANRWVYMANSLLAGIGIGLFIDEVGKFITQTNDYFYPAAAPIIYVFFLLTFLVYIFVRRPHPTDTRTELYYILEELEEVLDHDLSDEERDRILKRLETVSQNNTDPVFTNLALNLSDFFRSKRLYLKPIKPDALTRFLQRLEAFEKRILTQNRFRGALVGGLLAFGLRAISYPVSILSSLQHTHELAMILDRLVSQRLVRGSISLSLFNARLGLESSIGLILMIAAVLLALGFDRRALFISYFGLLVALTVVNPLLFYFEQFSMIITAAIQFVLLLAVVRYRKRFLQEFQEITI